MSLEGSDPGQFRVLMRALLVKGHIYDTQFIRSCPPDAKVDAREAIDYAKSLKFVEGQGGLQVNPGFVDWSIQRIELTPEGLDEAVRVVATDTNFDFEFLEGLEIEW